MVQDVGFWEAVGLWLSGQKLENFTMYGCPMLYWARIGKCLQFIGGAAIVLDLIGPQRLREWGDSTQRVGKCLWRKARSWWRLSIPVKWDTTRQSDLVLTLSVGFAGTGMLVGIPAFQEGIGDDAPFVLHAVGLLGLVFLYGLMGVAFGQALSFSIPPEWLLLLYRVRGCRYEVIFSFLPVGGDTFEWIMRSNFLPLRSNMTRRSLVFLIPWALVTGIITWLFFALGVVEESGFVEVANALSMLFIITSSFVWVLFQAVLVPITLLAYFSQAVLLKAADVFRKDHPGHPIRWVAFIFVFIGFCLDLLGS
ncbi:hypothetical protein [Saccharopolyspora sp. NPDC002686]|uniref:hypothetical protein n=1 Tax=Saccharopolyspora sp. NPDC002686 TaxID=3154541 RepID=UPI003321209B